MSLNKLDLLSKCFVAKYDKVKNGLNKIIGKLKINSRTFSENVKF